MRVPADLSGLPHLGAGEGHLPCGKMRLQWWQLPMTSKSAVRLSSSVSSMPLLLSSSSMQIRWNKQRAAQASCGRRGSRGGSTRDNMVWDGQLGGSAWQNAHSPVSMASV